MSKYSIIVPAFNAADRINKTLDSIRYQTFDDYELIVVCDSCEDNTAEIARKYTRKVFEVDFGNDGLARSKGLDEATGEWIIFLDDDDWWLHPLVLQSIDERLNKIGDETDVLVFAFYWNGVGYTPPISNGNILPNVWSKVWRRSFVGDTRFPNIEHESDLHFTNAVLDKNPRVRFWDNMLLFYNYMRPGSQTYNMTMEGVGYDT